MKKKIHVMTVRATAHIPVDPTDDISLGNAAAHIKALRARLELVGFGVVVKGLVHRVSLPPPLPLPEPETTGPTEPDPDPTEDKLEVPDYLVRTAEPKAAE